MGKEIGIDLGTTNTVVSYVNKRGKLKQLSYNKEEIIPSVIYFRSQSDYCIGGEAKKLLELNPTAGMKNFKTTIGDGDRHEIIAEDGTVLRLRSRDIAKLFLNKIVSGMENKLLREFGKVDGFIDRAIITVPAKFTSTQKGATKRAANEAGLSDVKLAAEPTAAAIAYEDAQSGENSDSVILVYDFGGGTFDVSVIRRKGSRGAFDEITTGGDKNLGGNLLTNKLVEEIVERINDDFGVDFPLTEDEFDEDCHGISLTNYRLNMSEIWRVADLIKEELSDNDNVVEHLNINLPNNRSELYELNFSREELENYIEDAIERTVDITLKVIDKAKEVGVNKIDQIVLAGGSSNIPLVKERLEERLQNQDIIFCDDAGTLISRGATVLAKRYAEIKNISEAVTNVQMGVAAMEGLQFEKFQIIIPEDVQLPCKRRRTFYLSQDNQRRLEIEYYERDIKNFPDAIYTFDDGVEQIDSLVIENLPPDLKANEVSVEVEFVAQKDGSLDINVELKDSSGTPIRQKNMVCAKRSDLE